MAQGASTGRGRRPWFRAMQRRAIGAHDAALAIDADQGIGKAVDEGGPQQTPPLFEALQDTVKNDGTNSTARQVEAIMPLNTARPSEMRRWRPRRSPSPAARRRG